MALENFAYAILLTIGIALTALAVNVLTSDEEKKKDPEIWVALVCGILSILVFSVASMIATFGSKKV